MSAISNFVGKIKLKIFQKYKKKCFSDFKNITAQKNEVFHKGFLQYMRPNPQETADLVTLTEEIIIFCVAYAKRLTILILIRQLQKKDTGFFNCLEIKSKKGFR